MNKKNIYLAAIILIPIIALFLRFFMIDARPMYFDEGTHWLSFINKIYTGETLIYIPDFHGFLSWYLSVLPLYVFGLSIFSLRFMSVFFSFLTVCLVFLLRKDLGKIGTILAALFLAISPAMIYYSRQVSQYPYLVFFTLASFVSLVYYFKEKKKIYFYLFAASIGFSFVTHEIVVIYLAAMATFLILMYHSNYKIREIMKKEFNRIKKEKYSLLVISLIIIALIVIVIMSCFFTNLKTLFDYLSQSSFAFNKSFNTGHNKNMFYYLKTFISLELFAFTGTFLSIFLLRRNIFNLFLFYWTGFSIVIFSIIPYKVPWMFILILLPMYLLSASVFDNIYTKLKMKKEKIVFYILIGIFLVYLIATSVNINYINSYSKNNPLNYAGPVKDNFRLINDLNNVIKSNETKILFLGDNFWPLHYYLRDKKNYFAREDTNISKFYDDYDFFIVVKEEKYDSSKLRELGVYELRVNYYIKVLYKNNPK
ncbi:MAG: TIGR03663 family protein [Candidatus Nanoarchaeia archaeon]|nr:TIGR03663 family protein [Candidatus Nanoarchaeia archaeon]